MDVNALRQFLVVAQHEHLSRAARELHIAQPALSRTIGRLEAQLGVELFDRRDRMRLNAAGSIYRAHVQRALGELDAGARAIDEAQQMGAGRVAVAAESLFTLMGALGAFKRASPRTEITLSQGSSDDLVQGLHAWESDLALLSQPARGGQLRIRELVREQVHLATPVGHPLAGREAVSMEELATEPFVTTRRGHWQRELLERLFAARGLAPRIVCVSDEPGATAGMISAGIGIGLLPRMARMWSDEAPIAWADVDDPQCMRVLSLAWRPDLSDEGAPARLRDHLMRWDWSQGAL
ncbi:LysR family transcriptional regulator [Microbacterium sp.]|uniref:LysR family transcriptional regulator n=1 Tax=Microbacterium sp. TaxID=51671 RepID=UPI003C73D294